MSYFAKFTLICFSLSAFGFISLADAYSSEELAKYAKVDMDTARSIALQAQPGKITSAELDQADTGLGLYYSFDIHTAQATVELDVDAQTGKILKQTLEKPLIG